MAALALSGRPAIAGGRPAFDEFLVFGAPLLGEEEIQGVVDVLRSGWLGTGERTIEFEAAFAEAVGARHAVGVSSCTAGLHLALVAAGIGPGDEVITTAMTFVATVNAIVHAGATPVLADIDGESLNVDLDDVARLAGPRTKAIIPVHFGGLPVDPQPLRALADAHGLHVVEDAAHALGAVVEGRPIGGGATIACFSFYPNKNITTGEGGMVTTADDQLAERLHILRLHGLSRDAWERFRTKRVMFSDAVAPGFKYNMIDLQAALGLVQLRRLDEFLEARCRLALVYDEALANVPGVRAQPRPWTDSTRHAHHLYAVEIDEIAFGAPRDELLAALRAENIGAGVHYKAVHLHPYYRDTLDLPEDALPVASRVSGRLLSLPLSPVMADDDARLVAAAIERIHAHVST
jgi:dTDP-4-amino-4,6-dideoxygalactose transaminase